VRIAAAACAAALVVGGCGGGKTTTGLSLSPCTIGPTGAIHAQCGDLSVPENPFYAKGKHIPIHVAVVRRTEPKATGLPIFDFAGWGGAGVEDDAWLSGAFANLNVSHDIVFVDQRGTGRSNPLSCAIPETDAATITRATKECVERIGPDLKYYTSAIAVDDVDRVRAALGYDKIDLYGASYGVTTEQFYLLRHGVHVHRAVLDSGSLLPVHIFENGPRNAQRALDMLFAQCAADAACTDAFGNVKAQYATLAARVARKPVPLPEVGAELGPETLAAAVDALLPFDKPQLPRFIHLLATGKATAAAAIVKPYLPAPSARQLAYMLVIQCSEPWAMRRPAVAQRLAAGTFYEPLAHMEIASTAAMCKAMIHGYEPAAAGMRAHSTVPVLFLQGNEDPADPPSAVAHARRELPNSRVVVFPYSGHGQIGYACAQFLATRFFEGDGLQKLDTTCASSAALAPFDTRR